MITKCCHLDCLADKTSVCSRDLKPTSPFCTKAEKSTVNHSVGLAAFLTAAGNISFIVCDDDSLSGQAYLFCHLSSIPMLWFHSKFSVRILTPPQWN